MLERSSFLHCHLLNTVAESTYIFIVGYVFLGFEGTSYHIYDNCDHGKFKRNKLHSEDTEPPPVPAKGLGLQQGL